MPTYTPVSLAAAYAAVFAGILAAATCHAAVVISAAPTLNLTCSGGTCTPTAHEAVLNVADLASMLGNGSITISTTGNGIEAKDIRLQSDLSWSTQAGLTLEAYRSIEVAGTVMVAGPGSLALAITEPDPLDRPTLDGTLLFRGSGRVVLQNPASQLSINGTPYVLVDSIATLAAAVAANPAGSYALRDNYDASADGTYRLSPVQTELTGNFDGLGNTISNLRITYTSKGQVDLGLFSTSDTNSFISNLRVAHADIEMRGRKGAVGVIAGSSSGRFVDDRAGGVIYADKAYAGGLLGGTDGEVSFSSAHVDVTASVAGGLIGTGGYAIDCSASGIVTAAQKPKSAGYAGGLVGYGSNVIQSYATGKVRGGPSFSNIGALVGEAAGVVDSYATGDLHVSRSGTTLSFNAGGLAGGIETESLIDTSYSTGGVRSGPKIRFGGFYGGGGPQKAADDYWDTTTSGTTDGYPHGNDPRVTGLTTAQLQSGLPKGFAPTVWAEKPGINNGLPYLINNPPMP